MERWKRIDELAGWRELVRRRPEILRGALTPGRLASRTLPAGGGLSYSYAAMDADDWTIASLAAAATELGLVDQYRALASGEVMNVGESRMVLHHLARGTPCGPVVKGGRDYRAFYEGERSRAASFAAKVRSGELRGSTGKRFERAGVAVVVTYHPA
ncbi:MAG TPA: glucose-6-phosphate isomerase, partial [Spirochaetales bacterium]|nr:glucose-6-phosphate isomerase [Spirochaetales bacterium]